MLWPFAGVAKQSAWTFANELSFGTLPSKVRLSLTIALAY
jgi:hypothetical protein